MGLACSFLRLVCTVTTNATVLSYIGVLSVTIYQSYYNKRKLDEQLAELNKKRKDDLQMIQENLLAKCKVNKDNIWSDLKSKLDETLAERNHITESIGKKKEQLTALIEQGKEIQEQMKKEKETLTNLKRKQEEEIERIHGIQETRLADYKGKLDEQLADFTKEEKKITDVIQNEFKNLKDLNRVQDERVAKLEEKQGGLSTKSNLIGNDLKNLKDLNTKQEERLATLEKNQGGLVAKREREEQIEEYKKKLELEQKIN
ncbi:Hypothetical predicted protein [Mytilus galloprovincialis]|uniref:Uncharacterized protein n=1 Tax=Mytilus galloprovincialis TaxID=29158 RepID=A0A8B6HRZ9_MYTGA|nr:Hypothetical predicted protein [Mytilus galloprovincialis]